MSTFKVVLGVIGCWLAYMTFMLASIQYGWIYGIF